MTRTQNSFFNFITSLFSNILVLALSFITRTVFIRYLADYLGIEGLFSSILQMLSLTELGFGSAIVFKLYKPIEQQDHRRIRVLMRLYRRVYFVVGWIIVGVGLCLIPALPYIVRDYGRLAELHLSGPLIFLLYLFNSAASYWFFAYKNAFVQANQKTYILTVIGYALSILSSLLQILALVLLRSFVAYLIAQIAMSIVRNLIFAIVCDRRYPFLRIKTDERISREERREFVKDCSSLFLYRVSNVVINSTDNIVLSSSIGLSATALYYPYITVRTAILNLLYTFINSIQASLGSLYSTGNLEWSRLIFRVVNFVTVWIFGVGAVGTAVLLSDFITLWIGQSHVVSSWSFGGTVVTTPMGLLVGIEILLSGQTYYCGSFRNAMGLFQQLKYRPIASILVNLIVSVLTVPYLGIAGCVAGTIAAHLTTNLLVDPIVISRHALRQSPGRYFLRNLLYKLILAASGLLCWYLCGLIPLAGVGGFIVRGCVCVIVPSAAFTACFFKTKEFRFLVSAAKGLIPKRS